MASLLKVQKKDDIPEPWQDSPLGLLLEYHNLGRPPDPYEKAQLLVGMCMDNRKSLRIPDKFAYIIRVGGANLRWVEFQVSYAIGVGGVRAIALIGHNHCAMVNLISRKDAFIEGLVKNAGWDPLLAEDHFKSFWPMFEIENEVDFLLREVKRLRVRYPKIQVAPLMYNVDDHLLYLVKEG